MASSRTPRAPRVELHITSELIKDSVSRDSSHCMWADAVREAYPDATRVSVDLQTIRFSDPKKGLRYTYLTPRVAQIALIDFDQGHLPDEVSCLLRNGQVTRAAQKTREKNLSESQLKQRREAAARGQETLGKARMVSRGSKSSGVVPDRVGGKTPPTTPFARRRAFGLRALAR